MKPLDRSNLSVKCGEYHVDVTPRVLRVAQLFRLVKPSIGSLSEPPTRVTIALPESAGWLDVQCLGDLVRGKVIRKYAKRRIRRDARRVRIVVIKMTPVFRHDYASAVNRMNLAKR